MLLKRLRRDLIRQAELNSYLIVGNFSNLMFEKLMTETMTFRVVALVVARVKHVLRIGNGNEKLKIIM